MKTKEIARVGLLCAVAAVLGYIESLLPPFVPVQGFKIGLANIAVMLTLYLYGTKQAAFVVLVKVLVTSLWFAAPSTFIYSFFGGALALFAMSAAKRLGLSTLGVGIAGGVFHNVGQLLTACIILKSFGTLYLAPILLPLGIVSGAVVGVIVALIPKANLK